VYVIKKSPPNLEKFIQRFVGFDAINPIDLRTSVMIVGVPNYR